MFKFAIATLVAAATAGALAAVAAANPPERTSFDVAAEITHEPCGFVEEIVFHVTLTEFVDGDVQAQVAYEGTITDPATGATYPERGHQTIVFGADGSYVFSGTAYVITQSGDGLLLLDAGRLVVDAEGNVVHASAQTAADTSARLCAALS